MGVSGVICKSSKGVKEVCQGCCMGVSRVFEVNNEGVSRVLEGGHKGVKGVTLAFQGCYKSLT